MDQQERQLRREALTLEHLHAVSRLSSNHKLISFYFQQIIVLLSLAQQTAHQLQSRENYKLSHSLSNGNSFDGRCRIAGLLQRTHNKQILTFLHRYAQVWSAFWLVAGATGQSDAPKLPLQDSNPLSKYKPSSHFIRGFLGLPQTQRLSRKTPQRKNYSRSPSKNHAAEDDTT